MAGILQQIITKLGKKAGPAEVAAALANKGAKMTPRIEAELSQIGWQPHEIDLFKSTLELAGRDKPGPMLAPKPTGAATGSNVRSSTKITKDASELLTDAKTLVADMRKANKPEGEIEKALRDTYPDLEDVTIRNFMGPEVPKVSSAADDLAIATPAPGKTKAQPDYDREARLKELIKQDKYKPVADIDKWDQGKLANDLQRIKEPKAKTPKAEKPKAAEAPTNPQAAALDSLDDEVAPPPDPFDVEANKAFEPDPGLEGGVEFDIGAMDAEIPTSTAKPAAVDFAAPLPSNLDGRTPAELRAIEGLEPGGQVVPYGRNSKMTTRAETPDFNMDTDVQDLGERLGGVGDLVPVDHPPAAKPEWTDADWVDLGIDEPPTAATQALSSDVDPSKLPMLARSRPDHKVQSAVEYPVGTRQDLRLNPAQDQPPTWNPETFGKQVDPTIPDLPVSGGLPEFDGVAMNRQKDIPDFPARTNAPEFDAATMNRQADIPDFPVRPNTPEWDAMNMNRQRDIPNIPARGNGPDLPAQRRDMPNIWDNQPLTRSNPAGAPPVNSSFNKGRAAAGAGLLGAAALMSGDSNQGTSSMSSMPEVKGTQVPGGVAPTGELGQAQAPIKEAAPPVPPGAQEFNSADPSTDPRRRGPATGAPKPGAAEAAQSAMNATNKVQADAAEIEKKVPGWNDALKAALTAQVSGLEKIQAELRAAQAAAGKDFKDDMFNARMGEALTAFAQAMVKYAAASEGVRKKLDIAPNYKPQPVDFTNVFKAIDTEFQQKIASLRESAKTASTGIATANKQLMDTAARADNQQFQQGQANLKWERDLEMKKAELQALEDRRKAGEKFTAEQWEREANLRRELADKKNTGAANYAGILVGKTAAPILGAENATTKNNQDWLASMQNGLNAFPKLKGSERQRALQVLAAQAGVQPVMTSGMMSDVFGATIDEQQTLPLITAAMEKQRGANPNTPVAAQLRSVLIKSFSEPTQAKINAVPNGGDVTLPDGKTYTKQDDKLVLKQ